MKNSNRVYRALAGALLALAVLCDPSAPPAQADNVPVSTSPIAVTGLTVRLRRRAPDRETGKAIDVILPTGLIGQQMNNRLSTSLSSQMDRYWNTNVDAKTGMTPRTSACDAKTGIKYQVVTAIAKERTGYSAYDVSCNLAQLGQLLAKQIGSNVFLSYLLTNNTVSLPQLLRSHAMREVARCVPTIRALPFTSRRK